MPEIGLETPSSVTNEKSEGGSEGNQGDTGPKDPHRRRLLMNTAKVIAGAALSTSALRGDSGRHATPISEQYPSETYGSGPQIELPGIMSADALLVKHHAREIGTTPDKISVYEILGNTISREKPGVVAYVNKEGSVCLIFLQPVLDNGDEGSDSIRSVANSNFSGVLGISDIRVETYNLRIIRTDGIVASTYITPFGTNIKSEGSFNAWSVEGIEFTKFNNVYLSGVDAVGMGFSALPVAVFRPDRANYAKLDRNSTAGRVLVANINGTQLPFFADNLGVTDINSGESILVARCPKGNALSLCGFIPDKGVYLPQASIATDIFFDQRTSSALTFGLNSPFIARGLREERYLARLSKGPASFGNEGGNHGSIALRVFNNFLGLLENIEGTTNVSPSLEFKGLSDGELLYTPRLVVHSPHYETTFPDTAFVVTLIEYPYPGQQDPAV